MSEQDLWVSLTLTGATAATAASLGVKRPRRSDKSAYLRWGPAQPCVPLQPAWCSVYLGKQEERGFRKEARWGDKRQRERSRKGTGQGLAPLSTPSQRHPCHVIYIWSRPEDEEDPSAPVSGQKCTIIELHLERDIRKNILKNGNQVLGLTEQVNLFSLRKRKKRLAFCYDIYYTD